MICRQPPLLKPREKASGVPSRTNSDHSHPHLRVPYSGSAIGGLRNGGASGPGCSGGRASPGRRRLDIGTAALTARTACGMSIQRVMQDPVPLLILFGLILLIVWLWRRFKRR
jgi:hypothetical protein